MNSCKLYTTECNKINHRGNNKRCYIIAKNYKEALQIVNAITDWEFDKDDIILASNIGINSLPKHNKRIANNIFVSTN